MTKSLGKQSRKISLGWKFKVAEILDFFDDHREKIYFTGFFILGCILIGWWI